MIEIIISKSNELIEGYAQKLNPDLFMQKALILDLTASQRCALLSDLSLAKCTTIIIEQPEIGLHPCDVHDISKAICQKHSESKGAKISVITHSKTLLNIIGDFIEDEVFTGLSEAVTISRLEEDECYTSKFDNEGCLIDWPIGYMSGR